MKSITRAIAALTAAITVAGCAAFGAAPPVEVRYEFDRYGAAYPVVDGEAYRMTAEDRRTQVQLLVDAYCPAGAPE